MRGLVADSWRRCRVSDVRTDGSRPSPPRWAAEELNVRRRAHPLAAVLPLLCELLGSGDSDDGHVFAVADADGTPAPGRRGPGSHETGRAHALRRGSVWTEGQAGTNAYGTAMELGNPVQIVAGEYCSAAVHDWSAPPPRCVTPPLGVCSVSSTCLAAP